MASRTEVEGTFIDNTKWRSRRHLQHMVIPGNVDDNFELDADSPPVILLGASAARNIRMPEGSQEIDGLTLELLSTSTTTTGQLTLQTATGAALSPAVVVDQQETAQMIYVHGTGWLRRFG